MNLQIKEEIPQPLKQTLCEICQKQFSNYICPRCNLRYCSLVCYKDLQHAECTENFYKQSITEEIENQSVDKESKTNMLNMLKRLQEEEDPLDQDQDELAELFQDLDLEQADPQEIWRRLPPKERKEFESMLSRLDDVWHTLDLPDYIPWWRLDIPKIYDMDHESPLPSLPTTTSLPRIKELKPHLIWNLLHILIVYSYLMRHTTGQLLQDYSVTIHTVTALSDHLLFSNAASCPFGSVDDVMTDAVERILRLQDTHNTKARYDLKRLLLQDLICLLPHAQHAVLDLWQAMNKLKPKKKSLSLAVHKVYYYGAVAVAIDTDFVMAAVKEAVHKLDIDQKEFEKDCQAAKLAIQKQQQVKIKELE